MQLSEHFSLEELTRSDTATRLGIDNSAPEMVIDNLRILAERLEEVRALLGHPIIVSSGYRSIALNKAVRGSVTSAHTTGLAADFSCPKFGDPKSICIEIAASTIKFDKLIWEFDTWVHISFQPMMRREIYSIHNREVGYQTGIV